MRRASLEDVIRGVDALERRWLLDDLDLEGTTGLVRFEQLNPYAAKSGEIQVKACGLMHAYATIEIAWSAPPGWSANSRLTPVCYYLVDGETVTSTGKEARDRARQAAKEVNDA